MDGEVVLTQLETQLAAQLLVAGADPTVEAAGSAVAAALRPAVREAVLTLAAQAAAEVRAQLSGYRVEVVMSGQDPNLVVTEDGSQSPQWSDIETRVTLRLPDELKQHIETAAKEAGDSLNSHMIKLLGKNPGRKRTGGRMSGTIET